MCSSNTHGLFLCRAVLSGALLCVLEGDTTDDDVAAVVSLHYLLLKDGEHLFCIVSCLHI